MVGLDDHLKDPLYANWVKNTRALSIINATLRPYVVLEVSSIHRSIISRCPAGVTCESCYWRRAPSCPKKFCDIIKREIENNHRYGEPSFDNTNAKKWKTDAWEIAKCFMPLSKGYRECTSSEADFSAIVNIIINGQPFDALVSCDLNHSENIFSKARKMRNDLMHSDKQKVSERDLQSNLDLLICLLNDFKTKPPKSHEVIDEIKKLKAGKLQITTKDVLDARTEYLLENGATEAYVNNEIEKLRREIQEAVSIWEVPQHRLIDKFVKGCKHSLVKIMECHIDNVRPKKYPKDKWDLNIFLDKIQVTLEIKALSELHMSLLYPDDGNVSDIKDWDLFLLCHILSIESVGHLDNKFKGYIQEVKRVRNKILVNPDVITESDFERLADFLEEPLGNEVICVYAREDPKEDAVKLQFMLTSWQQNEEIMENKQININTLQQQEKQAARIDDLESKVQRLYEMIGDQGDTRAKPEKKDQGIVTISTSGKASTKQVGFFKKEARRETQVQIKPKDCDKEEEKQVQDNMTSGDETENIAIANGGIGDFREQLNLKTAQPIKGSIILKVTCKSIKDLIHFWNSCVDGSAVRALSKVRDDYRNFLGCDTLDFDIVLTKTEVNRCINYLVDRLSSSIPDASLFDVAQDKLSVEVVNVSNEEKNVGTEDSDRDDVPESLDVVPETELSVREDIGAFIKQMSMQTFPQKREFDAEFMPFEVEAPMSAVAVRSKKLVPDEDAQATITQTFSPTREFGAEFMGDVKSFEEEAPVPAGTRDSSLEGVQFVPVRRKELASGEDVQATITQTFSPTREFGAEFMGDVKSFEEEAPVPAGTRDSSLEGVQFVPVRRKELASGEDVQATITQTFSPTREFGAEFMGDVKSFEEEAPVPAGTRDSSLEGVQFVPVRRKELASGEDVQATITQTFSPTREFGAEFMGDVKSFEEEAPVPAGTRDSSLEGVQFVPVRRKELASGEDVQGLSRSGAYSEEDARRLSKFLEEIAENFEEGKISAIKPYFQNMIKHSKDRDMKAFEEDVMDFTGATKFKSGISVTLMKQAYRGFRMILKDPDFGDLLAAKVEAIEKEEKLSGEVESKAWLMDAKKPTIEAEDIQVGDKITGLSVTIPGKRFESASTSMGEFGYDTTIEKEISFRSERPGKDPTEVFHGSKSKYLDEKTKGKEPASSIRKPATETLPKS